MCEKVPVFTTKEHFLSINFVKQYNQSVNEINNCLRSLKLFEHQLPVIDHREMVIKTIEAESKISEHSNGSHSHFDSVTATTDI